jgi:hypothetical protein
MRTRQLRENEIIATNRTEKRQEVEARGVPKKMNGKVVSIPQHFLLWGKM